MTKTKFKLWLLALALAIALTWYCIHPAPAPIRQRGKENDNRDGRRCQAHAGSGQLGLESMRLSSQPAFARIPAVVDDDLPVWPEYIEVG